MTANNGDGIIRIGRKGTKKFAFGDGAVFEVDIVTAFQQWIAIDDSFRPEDDGTEEQDRSVPLESMPSFHQAAVEFVTGLIGQSQATPGHPIGPSVELTVAEALDFIARLREQYDILASFFRPRKQAKDESPATSAEASLQFSEEAPSQPSTSSS